MQLITKYIASRSYLIESGIVNVCQEELKMASLCVGYLSLPGFWGLLSDFSIKELLNDGYYAFLDYAACHWTSHVQAGLSSRIDEGIVNALTVPLHQFLTIHYRDSDEHIGILDDTRRVLQRLESYSEILDFEKLLHAFQATKKQVESFGESAELNDALDMPDIIARIRRAIENAQLNTNAVNANITSDFYGSRLFKCSRMSCDFFHYGFRTRKQRDDHMMKHKNSFACSFPWCLRNALAFSSQNDLRRHISETHKVTSEGDLSFPSKRRRPALQCGGCEEYFYEPKKLFDHACAATTDHPKQTNGSTLSHHPTSSRRPGLFIKPLSRVLHQSRPQKETLYGDAALMRATPSSLGQWPLELGESVIPVEDGQQRRLIQRPPGYSRTPVSPQEMLLARLDLTWEQGQMQKECYTLKEQQSCLLEPIISRAAAESKWMGNLQLQPEIMSLYMDLADNTPSHKPTVISPEQKAIMYQLLMESRDMLGKLNLLVTHGISSMTAQENIRHLLAMRHQIMRQFRHDTQYWIPNNIFTIGVDYLIRAILLIRKLFAMVLFFKD